MIRYAAIALTFGLCSGLAQADNALYEVRVEGDRHLNDTLAYPSMALRRRVEGEVLVEFTVNEQGKAEDITIVEAKPRGFFDKTTIRAIENADYSTAVVDGKSAERKGVKKRFVYTIDDSAEDPNS